jgi:hypothetical protein
VNFCEIDGFVTDFAAGYKLRFATVFPRGPALTFIPALTFSHGVTGYSADQFTHHEGRMSLAPYLRTQIYQKYFVDAAALWYKGDVKFDALRDRGHYTVVLGMNL